MKQSTSLLTALLLWTAAVAAPPAHADDIAIEAAWARATPPSARTGAAYLTIRNNGPRPDRIIAMTTDIAGYAMGHETRQEGDVMKMQETPLTAPPGGVLEMKPGGVHVMLMDLTCPLKSGDIFTLSLTFDQAGMMTVPIKVGPVGAMMP